MRCRRPYSRSYFKFPSYLCDVCLWPKADIETESKSLFLNVRFGGKSGHSEDSIRLLTRAFSAVGVCSGLADKAKPA